MKRKIFSFICIAIIFSLPLISFAANKTANVPQSLDKKITKVISDFKEDINIGMIIQDATTGKILYQQHADRYFMPASNQKLFAAFATLRYLGKDFTYKTHLYLDTAKIQNGILQDNIYLQFSGDPTLTIAQLEQLLNKLAQAGIKRIEGNIIIDDTAFDQVTMSPGTTWDDQDFCYGSLLEMPKATLFDGAGGSRYNFITPRQILILLRKIYLSTDGASFIAALPIGGVDGSLKDSMQSSEIKGKIYAKTGTMRGVTALSGFLETKRKHTLIFSIMMNGFVDLPAKYKVLEERLCEALIENA
jgi:D-alanyl-D-alanine carboxypeptidase